MDDYIAEKERDGERMFDELHSDECGCWLCDGREPDARYLPFDLGGAWSDPAVIDEQEELAMGQPWNQ